MQFVLKASRPLLLGGGGRLLLRRWRHLISIAPQRSPRHCSQSSSCCCCTALTGVLLLCCSIKLWPIINAAFCGGKASKGHVCRACSRWVCSKNWENRPSCPRSHTHTRTDCCDLGSWDYDLLLCSTLRCYKLLRYNAHTYTRAPTMRLARFTLLPLLLSPVHGVVGSATASKLIVVTGANSGASNHNSK